MTAQPVHGTSAGRPTDVPRPFRGERETETETERTTTSSVTEPQSGRALTTHARISQIDPWDALTRVLSLLRPDWQPERIRGALLDDKRPPRAVVAAAIACALDRDTRHPAAIAHRSTGTTTPTPPAVGRDAMCKTHPGELATSCRGCAADRKAARTPDSGPLAAERRDPFHGHHPEHPTPQEAAQ